MCYQIREKIADLSQKYYCITPDFGCDYCNEENNKCEDPVGYVFCRTDAILNILEEIVNIIEENNQQNNN